MPAATMPSRVPVTAVIAARDAGAHIAACVASVSWAAETLVVEGGSSDDTRLIALSEGATVFTHPFSTIGRQRNLAVERARHDWVLVLDAEEQCSPDLAREVGGLVSPDAPPPADPSSPTRSGVACEAFAVPRLSLFNGRRLRGGRWRPDAPVRLFRRRLRFDESAGADRLVTGGAVVGATAAPLVREVDVAHEAVAERMSRAARDWALQQFANGRRASALALVPRAVGRFAATYVGRGGWRDGLVGVGLAFLDATETALRWTQLWALSRREDARFERARAADARNARELSPPPRAPR